MPTEDKKILKYNHGEKSLKAPFTIYADLECLLIKEQSCQNNPEKSYTETKAKHEPSGYSLRRICSFNLKERDMMFIEEEAALFIEEETVLKNFVKI